jgi:hypothetical protein
MSLLAYTPLPVQRTTTVSTSVPHTAADAFSAAATAAAVTAAVLLYAPTAAHSRARQHSSARYT